jgi:hypothetical protein
MGDATKPDSIEHWIADLRNFFMEIAPSLLPLFDVYSAEALFGRRFIELDLDSLQPGARIIEVGAGSLLLSCQLVREGFDVTALEPTASGFSHFEQLQQIVLQRATILGCNPQVLNLNAEDLSKHNFFDYAFSINVMEHVADVARVIANVGESLAVGASYHFTCPNYLFPYECHFNIPTLFSKQLTQKFLSQKIFSRKDIPDPSGTWESLNWITVAQVRKISKKLPWIRVTFNPLLLVSTLERISSDKNFSNRRSPTIRTLLILFVRLRLHRLLRFMPAIIQPIIDCRVEKISDQEIF